MLFPFALKFVLAANMVSWCTILVYHDCFAIFII